MTQEADDQRHRQVSSIGNLQAAIQPSVTRPSDEAPGPDPTFQSWMLELLEQIDKKAFMC